jgi:hypothetical protein
MMMGEPSSETITRPGRRLPPTAEVAVVTMMLLLSAGIYMAASLPSRPPLGLPTGLVAAAGALLVGNALALSRVREFAWDKFFLVGRYALLAYGVIGGMMEYILVFDDVRGGLLVLVTFILVVFTLNIPLLFAFSVARYQPASRLPDR